MSPKVYQKTGASLIIGFALFMSSCASQMNSTPNWYNPYRPLRLHNSLPSITSPMTLDITYTIVEEEANYPGGASTWMKHLKTNIKYPSDALRKGINGRVILSFDVTKQGEIVNIIVAKGLGYGCDQEALRLLVTSGKWTPAQQNGEAVNSRSTISITFKR